MEPTPPAERKTNPPTAAVRDVEEEQRALTTALMEHPDPFVRLIAHISERQLALSETVRLGQAATNEAVSKLTDSVRDLTSEVHQLSAQVSTLTGRHNELESRFGGGNSHHEPERDEASVG